MKDSMEIAKDSDGSKIDAFVSKALSFKLKLKEVSAFNEVLKLWRETSIPYEVDSISPYSIEYKNIQLEIYKRLSGDGYTVNNELTSGKLTSEQFELGYPWTSKNLGVVSGHFGKVAQALGAIGGFQSNKEVLEVIEFGSGWGELAIPLAKSGQKVTCVDIDAGLIARLKRIADREGYVISTINCDFVEAAKSITSRGFDCAVFQLPRL
jgi:2-polyprenyl-3-methyl-5-hydroxy-6-metoxy-1,4-benzoquinol methylase